MTCNDPTWIQTYKKECRCYYKYDKALKKAAYELEDIEQKIKNVRSYAQMERMRKCRAFYCITRRKIDFID